MAKPALGKGLGSLLGANADSGSPAVSVSPSGARGVNLGRGVGTLLTGSKQADVSAQSPPIAEPSMPLLEPTAAQVELDLPKWPFFAADAALLLATTFLVWQAPKPIGPAMMVFCFFAVAAGAMVALTPYYLDYRAASRRVDASRLPKWIMGEQPDQASPHRYIMHLQWPRFVGELTTDAHGAETIKPVWIDQPGGVSELRRAQLLKEAGDFVRMSRTIVG